MFLVNEPSVHAFACPRVYVLGAMIGGPRALVRREWPLAHAIAEPGILGTAHKPN